MRGKARKKILKLAINKDPNLLRSIIEKRGPQEVSKMSGTAVFTWAKRLYKECSKKDNWGGEFK
ncbi:hypothetical protein KAR91_25010 [Candidatus Pacearchaeota archaeon]|nr:hypothetical protein [Candidatus Pacearchaeota archaeon]